ncbi:MAG: hypothetical protein HN742_12895 [Lentisphaerae bacterium]|nr:hypothetical protein [Lentisphaerota bacterium]MBT4821476.1 hypothetical protein [Lentisphaerota bacterium]MBT5608901.1 hypothetical protein [Lentisphaerota bacterium]MBT7057387.1 hypothetical protein [Lentisphaerota bacterium]MBT7842767.1 hypothetical protein [Lentisphaerota bacterium]
MFIETWRWRIVVLCLGLGLIVSGVYGVSHPDQMMLNICYSRTSVFLQRLNTMASALAYMVVALSGGGLVYLVGYSVKRGLAIRHERQPIDYHALGKTIVAYVLLLIGIAFCVFLAQWFLSGTVVDPRVTPAAQRARPPSR